MAAATALLACQLPAGADTLYWDISDTSGLQAGGGTWDASGGTNWATSDTPGTDAPGPWTQGDDAHFIANGLYTVTLSGIVQANAIVVDNWAGPTINGGVGDEVVIGAGGISHTGNNPLIFNAPMTLGSSQIWHATHASNGIVVSSNLGETAANTSLTKTGGGLLTLAGNGLYTGATVIDAGTLRIGNGGAAGSFASSSITLNAGQVLFNSSGHHTYNGNITGAAGGTNTINKLGSGTLILSGTNTFDGGSGIHSTGGLNASGGRTIIAGDTTAGFGLTSGVTDGTSGMLILDAAGSINTARIWAGGTNRAGAFYQQGSSSTVTSQIIIGRGGYGLYDISDGTLGANSIILDVGSGSNSDGHFRQTGGVVTSSGLRLASNGDIATVAITGGTFNTGDISIVTPSLGNPGDRGEMTVANATVNYSGPVRVGNNENANAVLNLNAGGVFQTTSINGFTTSASPGGTRQVNIDGGTLGYTGTSTFSNLAEASDHYDIFLHGGGATINVADAGGRSTIAQPLRAPAGDGIDGTTYAITDGGEGYVGPPAVTIAGAPGATAIANMVDDGTGNGTYKVDSITITSPGVNAVNPTFSFEAVPGAIEATPVALNTTANLSGGLTKVGAGTLDLTAINTYTGETRIEAGTLRLLGDGDISSSSAVNVFGGATFNATPQAATTLRGLKGAGAVMANDLNVTELIAPGNSVGTLAITSGSLTISDGAVYDFEIDGTTASPLSDLLSISGSGGTVIFEGGWTLNLANLGSVDPEGLEFVIFDVNTAPTDLGSWVINHGSTGWSGGTLSFNSEHNQVMLTDVVPEPGSLALIGLSLPLLLRRRR